MKLPKSSGKPKRRRFYKPPLILRRVFGDSMRPTLDPGRVVIGFTYVRKIRPGQIVIFELDGQEQVKRVGRIRPQEIYMLGDNPGRSTDSRHYGWVSYDTVIARVVQL